MPEGRADSSTGVRQRRARLKKALQRDWATRSFEIKYQPQVNLRTRKIVRFEALLRWKPVAKAHISPKEFIPLAEEMGMIEEMGQWVLEQSCADAMQWPEEIGVAVNVSAISLQNPTLPSMVQKVVRDSGIRPSRLELEITETTEIIMNSQCLANLNAIRAIGVHITIDDLGVGHSSLKYLFNFSFDKIKVDGSYVAALDRSDRRGEITREIMSTVTRLCKNLDVASLAEGVETAEQLKWIMAANFTEVQGYLFGSPVAVDKVREMHAYVEGIWKSLAIPQYVAHYQDFSFFQVADAVNDIVIVTTADVSLPGPTIIYVNPAFTRLTGFTAQEAIGQTPRILQGPGTSRTTLDRIRDCLAEGREAHEKVLNYTKGGAPYWLDMRIEPLRDAAGVITHFIGIERDVTLDKRRLDELEYVADRDVLTGIPNRRAFLRAVEAEIATNRGVPGSQAARPLCMAWIDIDRFKDVNDQLGHPAGDAVLYRVADRLAENMRRVDMIGRLGGEEFAVCMPDVTIEEAHSLAERLRRVICANAIETLTGGVSITISIGIAELSAQDDAASFLARADSAMYVAKRAGGNRVFGAAVQRAESETNYSG